MPKPGLVPHARAVTTITLRVAPQLWLFLPPSRRRDSFEVRHDGTSSLGHVVEAAGVPLPEVGLLRAGALAVAANHRPGPREAVDVLPVGRPQPVPGWDGSFLLDVHLGTLARRLRLLGVDATCPAESGDSALVELANSEQRLLLTRDRALLKRRALWAAAYVYGSRPDDQLADLLDRFRPVLAPWTRCTICNGAIEDVAKAAVIERLEPGTVRTQDSFGRCRGCGRVYWRGAHARRLNRIVASVVAQTPLT